MSFCLSPPPPSFYTPCLKVSKLIYSPLGHVVLPLQPHGLCLALQNVEIMFPVINADHLPSTITLPRPSECWNHVPGNKCRSPSLNNYSKVLGQRNKISFRICLNASASPFRIMKIYPRLKITFSQHEPVLTGIFIPPPRFFFISHL